MLDVESDLALIRDTKDDDTFGESPERPVVAIPLAEWSRFLAHALDRSPAPPIDARISTLGDGQVAVASSQHTLTFSQEEWAAFLHDATVGRFSLAGASN